MPFGAQQRILIRAARAPTTFRANQYITSPVAPNVMFDFANPIGAHLSVLELC
jgi:hypothetical protein